MIKTGISPGNCYFRNDLIAAIIIHESALIQVTESVSSILSSSVPQPARMPSWSATSPAKGELKNGLKL
jgi:hypothetical protein